MSYHIIKKYDRHADKFSCRDSNPDLLHEFMSVRNAGEVNTCVSTVKNLLLYRLNALSHSKKVAFTLAETLITLAIIGIVAALTLPSLIQHHQDRAIVAGVKKAYSLLGTAFVAAQNEYGTANTWQFEDGVTPQVGWYNNFAPFLQIEECTNVPTPALRSPCYSNNVTIRNGDGSKQQYGISWSHGGKLKNGMYIFFRTGDLNYCSYGSITVDINGEKGPNTYGKDLFTFVLRIDRDWRTNKVPKLLPNGLFMDAGSGSKVTEEYISNCLANKSASISTAWILQYDNVDYLRCPEKLIATGAHSCKEADAIKSKLK